MELNINRPLIINDTDNELILKIIVIIKQDRHKARSIRRIVEFKERERDLNC